jgi:hypothetical protein
MRAVLITILILSLVLIGGGAIANTAYQVGLQTAVIAEGGAVVTPVVVHGAGWGWGPGFGLFGFFGFLLVLFLVFGLIRAIAGPRRGGWGGPNGHGPGSWESRAHERFETWHRESHTNDTPPAAG